MTGDRTDRYVRGELSPAEARELAQAALDSTGLFDQLSDSALAKAALYSAPLPRERWFAIAVAAAVAAVLLISLTIVRPWRTASAPPKPVLAPGILQSQPVLLASGLQATPTGGAGTTVFRSPQTDSRAPQIAGSIVSIEDGLAAIDVGSLDGLEKGSQLQVFRDDQSIEAIGRLQVTTVFRQRARGRMVDGQVRVKDRVRVDSSAHLEALLEQVDALYNRGAVDAASQTAEQASLWVQTANVPPVRESEWWNQVAILRILRGNYNGAEDPLTRALAATPKTDLAYARSMNNLGVLAELRGDRRTAQSRYAGALQALTEIPSSPAEDRQAVMANLARLQGPH